MKRIALSAVVCLLSVVSFSQIKATQTAKISVPTAQCDECKIRIEEYLKRMDGITYANVAVKKKEITVKYLSDRTNIENIKAAIANAGFDAGEISANPESYKLLPKCCKKAADGGGAAKQ